MDEAVLESPVSEVAPIESTHVETSAPEPDTETPVEDAPEPESDPEAPEEDRPAEDAETKPAIQDGRLSDEAKALILELRAKNPRLAAQVKDALFGSDALRKAFPGGLQEAKEFKAKIDAYGGVEAVEKFRSELDEFNGLDKLFADGNPQFVDKLIEGNADGFGQFAPIAFNKFAQLHPENYAAFICKVVAQDMSQRDVPLALARLQDFLGDDPRAQQAWGVLDGYLKSVRQNAQGSIVPDKKAVAPPDDRAMQLEARESELTEREWKEENGRAQDQIFRNEWTRLMGARKVSSEDRAAILGLFRDGIASLQANPDYQKTIARYWSAKDKSGYLKYQAATYGREVPRLLGNGFSKILRTKPGPTNGVKPPVQNGSLPQKPQAAAGKSEAGFQWINKAPTTMGLSVDYKKTTREMVNSGRAVLSDGRRVQWEANR